MNRNFWHGKHVFLTGHTGFKGGWLTLWLSDMGAKVYGFALPPSTQPNLFTACRLKAKLASHTSADIRNLSSLLSSLKAAQPDVVFHLAAQSLVRRSYANPIDTYDVNVMGTVNLLEAVRQVPCVRVVVNVTTDKCYKDLESQRPHTEEDALGGNDPYSSSKSCSELVTEAYRQSFLRKVGIKVASARAGNVIGGGDWAEDRLIPDFFRSADARQSLAVRYPCSIRPWQHVLEPLYGYLLLAERMYKKNQGFDSPWNFGPDKNSARSVRWIIEYLCSRVSGASWHRAPGRQPHETRILKLDSSRARHKLGWAPRWTLQTALDRTLAWQHAFAPRADMTAASLSQIHDYEAEKSR